LNTRTGTDLSTGPVGAAAAEAVVVVVVDDDGAAAVVVAAAGAVVVVRAPAVVVAAAAVDVLVAATGAESSESDPPSDAAPNPAKRIARAISTIAIARSGGPDDSGFGVVTYPTLIGASRASGNEVTTAGCWVTADESV